MVASTATHADTRETIEKRLVVLLAGRVAEEVLLGMVSSGAGGGTRSDLALATRLVFEAVGMLGLSAKQPPVWYGKDIERMRAYHAVAAEAEEMLKHAYDKARILIRSEKAYVESGRCSYQAKGTCSCRAPRARSRSVEEPRIASR